MKSRIVNKTGKTALVALLGASMYLGTAAHAQTQVKLQTETDSAIISEGYSLSLEEWSEQTGAFNADKRIGDRTASHAELRHGTGNRSQVWIGRVGTLLFDDFDYDGYHSGFSISIDVNSEFGDTEVYAKIYLRQDNQELDLLHKTGRFTVYGDLPGDEYRVDTELRNNFVAAEYDVIIDIHDAWNDAVLDTANPRSFSNLSRLPLEAETNTAPPVVTPEPEPEQPPISDRPQADVVVTEYTGAFGPLLLLLAAGAALARRYRSPIS